MPAAYGKGQINLQTKRLQVEIAGIKDYRSIPITDLGAADMYLGHD
jgi:hypothetical protein